MSEHTTRVSLSTDAAALSGDVRTAVGRMYSRFRSERSPGELGDAALAVLGYLEKQGPQSLTALSDHAHVTPGSMSQTVNRLTDEGYAVRIPDPTDGRKVLFEPTPEGIRVSAAALAGSRSWLDTRIAQLTESERAVLSTAVPLLRQIADS